MVMTMEITNEKPMCQHCKKKKANRFRGLCYTCYYTPEIRIAYQPRQKQQMTQRLADPVPGYCVVPTHHGPGSIGKMEVMAERFAAGANLFHPLDALLGG